MAITDSLTLPFSKIRFRRSPGFSFEEFLHHFNQDDKPIVDFSYITGAEKPIGKYWEIKKTLINDIKGSPETILRSFNETTRNSINRVIKKDLCEYSFIEEPGDHEVDKIFGYCSEFSKKMGIHCHPYPYFKGLQNSNRLRISLIYDKSDKLLVGHGYRLSKCRPELLFSFRLDPPNPGKEDLQILSLANRYGHYMDMIRFKELGYEEYDFGGISDGQPGNHKWKHIDEFKMYFGGKVTSYYNSITYNTLKSKIYLRLRGAPF